MKPRAKRRVGTVRAALTAVLTMVTLLPAAASTVSAFNEFNGRFSSIDGEYLGTLSGTFNIDITDEIGGNAADPDGRADRILTDCSESSGYIACQYHPIAEFADLYFVDYIFNYSDGSIVKARLPMTSLEAIGRFDGMNSIDGNLRIATAGGFLEWEGFLGYADPGSLKSIFSALPNLQPPGGGLTLNSERFSIYLTRVGPINIPAPSSLALACASLLAMIWHTRRPDRAKRSLIWPR